jgi:hypothetical protein
MVFLQMAIRTDRMFFTPHRVAILLIFLTMSFSSRTLAQARFQCDFQKPLSWSGCGVGPNAVMLADLNGDNNLDVVAVDIGVRICLGDGHGNFKFFAAYPTPTSGAIDYTSALAIGDFAQRSNRHRRGLCKQYSGALGQWRRNLSNL